MFLFSFIYGDGIVKEKENVMRIRQLFLFAFCLVFLSGDLAFGASANTKPDRTKITSREVGAWKVTSTKLAFKYEQLVREVRANKNKASENMNAMRAYYPYTPYYDPFSKKIIDEMTEYAYIIDTSEDREQINIALEKYRDLVNKHAAHLAVVDFALTLSRLDIRYGDESLFKHLRDAIQNSWFGLAQPGLSPERAYKITTYAEEEYLLSTYGAVIEKSEIYKVGRSYYDVRDVITEDGESLQLFFDVTTPIRTIQIKKVIKELEKKVVIPLQ